jgi:hypothetical protein
MRRCILMAIICLLALPANTYLVIMPTVLHSGPNHIQSSSQVGTSSGSSVTFSGLSAVGSGNTILAFFQVHQNTNTITSITMGGNTLTAASFLNPGTTYSTLVAYGLNITGGPTSLTINFSGTPAGTDHYMILDEYSGTGTSVDQTNTTRTTSTTTAAAAVTTTGNGDLIWTGLFNGSLVSNAPPTSFALRNNDVPDGQYSADFVQTSAGTITPTWTVSPATTMLVGTIAVLP